MFFLFFFQNLGFAIFFIYLFIYSFILFIYLFFIFYFFIIIIFLFIYFFFFANCKKWQSLFSEKNKKIMFVICWIFPDGGKD